MDKRRMVGLVILTNIKALGGWVAILQRRGEWNDEKMELESYPGACQITVHGECEGDEGFKTAVMREFFEELGSNILLRHAPGEMVALQRFEDERRIIETFGIVIEPDEIKTFRLHAATGGLKFVTRDHAHEILDVKNFKKEEGIKDLDTIAMFPDEIVTLERAFEVFAPQRGRVKQRR